MSGFYAPSATLSKMIKLEGNDQLSEESQKNNSVSGTWRNPYEFERFVRENNCLALLDNLKNYDEKRKLNFERLEQLVLIGSSRDEVIRPLIS